MIAEFLNRDVLLRVIEDIKKLPTDAGGRRSLGTVTPEDAKLVLDELTAPRRGNGPPRAAHAAIRRHPFSVVAGRRRARLLRSRIAPSSAAIR